MPLSPKQHEVHRLITSGQHRVIITDGSVRSGKTFSTLLSWLYWLKRKAPKRGRVVIIGRTTATIAANVLDVIRDDIDPRAIGHYSPDSKRVKIMGRWVRLIGANTEAAVTKIQGATLAGAYVDELAVLPQSAVAMLLSRLSEPGALMVATTNPDNPHHWLRKKFLLRLPNVHGYQPGAEPLPDWAYLHFTMADNPGLPPEYVEAIKREYTGVWYRRFILGQWVSAEGAVYDMWDPDRHVIPWDELPKMQRLLGTGVDFGTTNASAALMLGLGVDGVLYLVDEWRTNRAADADGVQAATLTNAQQATGLTTWLKNGNHTPDDDGQLPRFIYIDPAAASFKAELYQAGWHNVTDAQNDVIPGISLIASGLAAGWLKVTDRCQGFISEAPGYSWNPKAQAAGIDKPIKTADHSLDAARYAIASTEHMWRPIINRLLLEGAYK